MRKIIQSINITADGFVDHTAAIADAELHENFNELMRSVDTILFGRVTYELMEFWRPIARERTAPKPMLDFADLINEVDKIVFSKTLKNTDWEHTTIIPDINKEEILKLKQKPGKDILVGGMSVISQFSQLGLIDEYHFHIHPIIEGGGKHLFETVKLENMINLKLTDTKILKSGVIAVKYAVKGK